jgi:hypothetical protein
MHTGLGAAIRGGYAEEDTEDFAPPLDHDDENDYLGGDYSETNPFPAQSMEFIDDFSEQDEEEEQDSTPGKGLNWSLIAAFVLSLGITWTVVSSLDPQGANEVKAVIVKKVPEDSMSVDIQEPPPAAPDELAQIEETAALMEALRQEQQQAQATAAIIEPEPTVQPPPVTVVEKRPLTAEQQAIAVIEKARESDFFVQHIVLSEKDQARFFIRRYSGLRSAIIVPIRTPASVAYAVISGPFASRERAEVFAKGYGRPADYWIRGALQLGAAVDNN